MTASCERCSLSMKTSDTREISQEPLRSVGLLAQAGRGFPDRDAARTRAGSVSASTVARDGERANTSRTVETS